MREAHKILGSHVIRVYRPIDRKYKEVVPTVRTIVKGTDRHYARREKSDRVDLVYGMLLL